MKTPNTKRDRVYEIASRWVAIGGQLNHWKALDWQKEMDRLYLELCQACAEDETPEIVLKPDDCNVEMGCGVEVGHLIERTNE